MAKTIETIIRQAIVERKKLSNSDLEAISQSEGYSLVVVEEAYKAVKKQIKEEKQAELAARLKLSYGKSEFVQKAVYLTDKNVVIFRNLDKNSIIVVREKDGALVIESVSVLSSKSRKYEFGKALARGNASNVKKALAGLTQGANWATFKSVVLGCSNTQSRESKGTVEESIEECVEVVSAPAEYKVVDVSGIHSIVLPA